MGLESFISVGQTSAEPLRASLALLPLGVVVLGRDGRVQQAEGGIFPLLGCAAEDIVGRPLSAVPELHWMARAAGEALGGRTVACRTVPAGQFEAIFQPVSGPHGDVAWVVAAVQAKSAGEASRGVLFEREALRAAEDAARRAAFLSHASRKLAETLDFETTIDTIARVAIPEFTDGCALFLLKSKAFFTPVTAAHSDPVIEQTMRELFAKYPPDAQGKTGMGRVAQTGESVFLEEVTEGFLKTLARSPEHLELLRNVHMKSYLSVPLAAHGVTLGVIAMATLKRKFSRQDLELAEELGRRCAAAVEHARLFAETKKALRLREDFLGIAAHELRTPLTPLRLLLQSLERRMRKTESEGQPLVKQALRSVDRLGSLVTDLLDVTQLEAGTLDLHPEVFSLAGSLEEIVADFRSVSPIHELLLSVPDHEVLVSGDRSRIEQVISNLLDNAIKYSPRGGSIRVTLGTEGAEATFSVTDPGIGIAKEQQDKLFTRFFRAATAPTTRFGGLGLGLYISHSVVERHGGRIWIGSEPERGSTFFVALPLAPGSQ